MKFVAAIGLVLFQASLYSCRTHNSVSLAHDASAEVSVMSPTKNTKLTQLIPILESLDSPDTKITKIKRLIPIYSELNKWKIRNKKQLVEILPLKKKGKPLAIILSGQPSYGTNERRSKQNGAGPYELSSSEETENDSEEWNHRGISDHHNDIHKSHSLNLHKNHPNHSHIDKITQKNNSLEHPIFATNSKSGESKHRYSDSNKSETVDDILKNSIELHHGHHSNHVHKSYLNFDSHSYESHSNSNETDFNRHLTRPVQLHTHTASPKHAYHEEVTNSYSGSNELDINIDSTESGPLELYKGQSNISKHNHNHHIKNKDIGLDSVSDSNESDSVLVPIELESNEDSVSDSSSESNESNIRSDLSESDFDSDSISYPESYESNLNNKNKQFDLHLYSETSESISDSKSEELVESDQILGPLFTESNRTINSSSDNSSGDHSKSYLKSHVLEGSDSESMPYLISSELLSGSQSASSETLFENSESALSSESKFDSSASIFAASVSESKSTESHSKPTESHSKPTESFPESWSDESLLDTSDSASQSSETNVAYRTFSEVRDFISESKEIRESSVSDLGSSESALESSESTLRSSESALGSSESALELSQSALDSSESTLGSSETTLDNSESTLGSSESSLDTSESTIETSEPALESNELILESSDSTLEASESTLESSESNLETSESVSKINEPGSKYSEYNESSESVYKYKSALESNESEFHLELSEASSEPCQTKLKSKESLESEVSQIQTSPQITDSRRHNCGDSDHKSLDSTSYNTAAQKEVRKLSHGKKTYRLSFVFNK